MYLDRAAYSGNSRITLALIKNGANVNAADADGWTALHVVILLIHSFIIAFFIILIYIFNYRPTDTIEIR